VALGTLPDEEQGDGAVFAEINITPLTDIFLVLLIIFMVTSSVIVQSGVSGQSGVKVNLPKGSKTDISTQGPQTLAVAILSDGRIVVGGQVLSQDELKARFTEAAARSADTTVIVQADSGVAHGRVVEVMELAAGAGLERLAIATQGQQ